MTELSNNALSVCQKRYFISESETWQDCSKRSGYHNGQIETDKSYIDKFSEMIYNLDFLPAGRILRNSGRPRGSMLNCYVLPVGDSIEEIFINWKAYAGILWSEGGGVGINLSSLRPENASIKGKGGSSSGPVSFLRTSDSDAECIKVGGGRRAAGLALMEVTHPDIIKFMDAKLIDGVLKNYNISVGVNEDFLMAVEQNKDWEFKFLHQSYGKIKARIVWDKILENMINSAEPGLLNLDNLFSNNSYYYSRIKATNPCGEVPLESFGACCLGSLNLPNFISGKKSTNWRKLEEVIRLAVRFLDNVLDVNKYILKEIETVTQSGRRIGLGFMGLAEYLFAKEVKYGSEKAIQETEKLVKFIRNISYEESIKLAIEKGAFPKFDPVYYGKAHFVRTLPASLRMDIKEKGIRNVTIMAIAPTGTISNLPEVTGGIEPLTYKSYIKKDFVGDRIYVNKIYKKLLETDEEVPEWFVDSDDLKPEDHFEMQAIVQKYVDGSVSKTINMPKGSNKKQLNKLLLEYIHDLKGCTVYVDGSKGDQPYNRLTEEQTREFIKQEKDKQIIDEELTQCLTGKCDI